VILLRGFLLPPLFGTSMIMGMGEEADSSFSLSGASSGGWLFFPLLRVQGEGEALFFNFQLQGDVLCLFFLLAWSQARAG